MFPQRFVTDFARREDGVAENPTGACVAAYAVLCSDGSYSP
jgi:hypothetical protein